MLSRSAFLVLPLFVVAGCKRELPKPPPPPPPEVLVSTPVIRDVTDYELFTGRTEPAEKVDLKARVNGYLTKAPFKEGAIVKKGTLLFEIDQKPFLARLAEAQATLTQANARYERVEGDYLRGKSAYEKNGISREEYDRLVGDRKEALSAVDVAAARLDIVKQDLDYTQIKAPIAGRISRRLVDVGNDIKAADTILSTLVSVEPMYAMFDVDERTLLRQLLNTGALETARNEEVLIQIGLADEEGQLPHEGKVNFIDNRVDTNTGTMWMRGEFIKPNRPLTPGLFCRVRFPLGKAYQAILVAEQAIGTDQGQKFLYVVKPDNAVEYRQIKVGRLDNGLRVIKEGLKADELVVVTGLQRVRAGAVVAPKKVEMPNRSTNPNAIKEEH